MSLNIFINKGLYKLSFIVVAVFIVASCNKDLPKATPIIYPPANNSTTSIGTLISTDTSFSFFKAAATKVGMLASLNDSTKVFTVFLPNNAAFRVSGIPSVGVVNSLPLSVLGGIVDYAILPGEQYTSTTIPTVFPNIQLPTAVYSGSTLPGTTLKFNLTTFPSVRSNGFWDNNIPVIMPDIKMQNGTIHLVVGIVAPPSVVLKDALYNNPNLTYFKAAIARADSGQTGLNRFDSLLNYAVTNMTVLAPNDAAFQTLIFGLVYGNVLALTGDPAIANAQATMAVAAGPAFLSTNNVSTALIRGVMAYHFLATINPEDGQYEPNVRVFSVNFSPTPSLVTTLVNSSFAPHPGILVSPTFTTLGTNISIVSDLKFTGLGTFPPGGAPFSGAPATAVSLDNHAVNGVYYVIDQVLLPQ